MGNYDSIHGSSKFYNEKAIKENDYIINLQSAILNINPISINEINELNNCESAICIIRKGNIY